MTICKVMIHAKFPSLNLTHHHFSVILSSSSRRLLPAVHYDDRKSFIWSLPNARWTKFQGYDRLGKRIEQLAERQSNLCVLSRCGVKFFPFFFFFFFWRRKFIKNS